MEGLKLVNESGEIFEIYEDIDFQWIQVFDGDDAYYKLNKAEAKQIVEHLTKVFEL